MNPVLDENKINSLIHLLEDDDSQTYALIYDQIMGMGPDLMPYLMDAEDRSINPLLTERLQELYQQLNLGYSINELKNWKLHNSKNLYQGLSILAKYQYPRLELRKISDLINKIRQELWLEVNDNLTALEKVRILNHIFFEVYNFRGDSKDYYAPENSFINDVLMRRKGNPLTLSALYAIVAQSVNIPIYGVSLPRNYMVVYVEKLYSQSMDEVRSLDVLFYINPFNRGEIHSQSDIFNYLRRIKMERLEEYYLPCSNVVTLQRSLRNLVDIYTKSGDDRKVNDLSQMLDVLDNKDTTA
jgi:regulator of sirC expression with transglutaminase-like and TPR domain